MNIDKVYICYIYRLKNIKNEDINTKVYKNGEYGDFDLDNICRVKREISYVKKAMVYYSVLRGCFVDIETGDFYKLGYPSVIGELFIDFHKSKIYGKDLMNTNKKHYTKKKILKRYYEYKEGNINECE